MLKQGDEILYNNQKYIVVTDINYKDNLYYFVMNILETEDYFFCKYDKGIIQPIVSDEKVKSLLRKIVLK